MPKVLVADDDTNLLDMVTDLLKSQAYTVETTQNGMNALDLMKSFSYDVIVLDWDMPGYQGPDIVKAYRDGGGQAPILMLTGKAAMEEKEKGFLCGADDYLTKPFHPKELELRVRALMGRTVRTDKRVIKYGTLSLDLSKRAITCRDKKLNLTVREYSLLEFLIRHPDQLFTAEALMDRIWQADKTVSDKAVRVCILRVREKLDPTSSTSIVTVQGFGYKLHDQPGSSGPAK
jgi:DNA-binding response OmpR family regulator